MQQPWSAAIDRTPYVDGPNGAARSAQIDREHADTLAADDPMREALLASAAAWDAQALRENEPSPAWDKWTDALMDALARLDNSRAIVAQLREHGDAPAAELEYAERVAELWDDVLALCELAATGGVVVVR